MTVRRGFKGPSYSLPAYALDGSIYMHVDIENQIAPPQFRTVSFPLGDGLPRFHSVQEAEAAGRMDLIRCFVLDAPACCYREAKGGADRFPHMENFAPLEVGDPAWAEVDELADRMRRHFGPTEIWPLESKLMAILELRLQGRRSAEEIADEMRRYLKASGYGQAWPEDALNAAILRIPELQRRWRARSAL